jgi:hypothetical protein
MNETKRGAPTEDGDYDLRLTNGNAVSARRCCGCGGLLVRHRDER